MIKLERGIIGGRITAPGSKSYSQRAVVAAFLSSGETLLTGVDSSNDSRAALSCIEQLGAEVLELGEGAYRISHVVKTGVSSSERVVLDIGESGLSTRLFTPVASTMPEDVVITGHGSILKRPMDAMISDLEGMGICVDSCQGHLPLVVRGVISGEHISVDGAHGSQFISGLLFACSSLGREMVMDVSDLKSKPYVDMTIEVLSAFGGSVRHDDYRRFYIDGGLGLRGCRYNVEGDWSGASCLLVGAAVSGSSSGVFIDNLNISSSQADMAIMDALRLSGARFTFTDGGVWVYGGLPLRGFEFDATHCPDLFPALAVLAAGCEGVSSISGVGRLKHKESDRERALIEEFGKVGVRIESSGDVMSIYGTSTITGGVCFDSWNDHRIAMSTAVLSLRADSDCTLLGSESVGKSYPSFWSDLQQLTARGV